MTIPADRQWPTKNGDTKMEYSNLTADAIEIIEGANPTLSNQLKLALKQISTEYWKKGYVLALTESSL